MRGGSHNAYVKKAIKHERTGHTGKVKSTNRTTFKIERKIKHRKYPDGGRTDGDRRSRRTQRKKQ